LLIFLFFFAHRSFYLSVRLHPKESHKKTAKYNFRSG
jgi:hypothetical protein